MPKFHRWTCWPENLSFGCGSQMQRAFWSACLKDVGGTQLQILESWERTRMFQVRILQALARFSRLGLAMTWVEVGAWEVDVAFGASPTKKSFSVKRRLTKLSEFPSSDGALVLQIFKSVYLMIKLLRSSRWGIYLPCLHRNFPKMTKIRVSKLLAPLYM